MIKIIIEQNMYYISKETWKILQLAILDDVNDKDIDRYHNESRDNVLTHIIRKNKAHHLHGVYNF